MVEHLTALDVLHDQVEVLGVLEVTEEVDDEGALYFLEQGLLVLGVIQLLHLDHLGLVQNLDRQEVSGGLVLRQDDTPKRPSSQGDADIEILNAEVGGIELPQA